MRKYILIQILIFKSIFVFSQNDSTFIYYNEIENKDLRTICELSDIQIEKIFCKDTFLRGKVFNIIIKEFKKGKIQSKINFNITSKTQDIPMVVNGQNYIYQINYTTKAGFNNFTDSFAMTFAGILKDDKFKLKVDWPGISITEYLKGNTKYSLRRANSCSDNKIKIPINKEYPIFAYTPPISISSNSQSYCLLGIENINDWYGKFNVKHYYVIYLEIK